MDIICIRCSSTIAIHSSSLEGGKFTNPGLNHGPPILSTVIIFMIGHTGPSIISGSSTANSPKVSSADDYTSSSYSRVNILHHGNCYVKSSIGIIVNVDTSITTSNAIMETFKKKQSKVK